MDTLPGDPRSDDRAALRGLLKILLQAREDLDREIETARADLLALEARMATEGESLPITEEGDDAPDICSESD